MILSLWFSINEFFSFINIRIRISITKALDFVESINKTSTKLYVDCAEWYLYINISIARCFLTNWNWNKFSFTLVLRTFQRSLKGKIIKICFVDSNIWMFDSNHHFRANFLLKYFTELETHSARYRKSITCNPYEFNADNFHP